MRLILIRHCEPDYMNNTLTAKGFREAQILKDRVVSWDAEAFYVSPVRRAQLTIEPALEILGKEAEVLDWMHEFDHHVTVPETGQFKYVPWDYFPEYWTDRELFYDRDRCYEDPAFSSNPEIPGAFAKVKEGLDSLLSRYGYHRDGSRYRCDRNVTDGDEDRTIVLTAHLGLNSIIIAHLLGVSPLLIQHGVFQAASSVTVLHSEKRDPAWAMFRIQVLGDTSHLKRAGEPVSSMGAFSEVFNG